VKDFKAEDVAWLRSIAADTDPDKARALANIIEARLGRRRRRAKCPVCEQLVPVREKNYGKGFAAIGAHSAWGNDEYRCRGADAPADQMPEPQLPEGVQ
jgi:hypothetical protein